MNDIPEQTPQPAEAAPQTGAAPCAASVIPSLSASLREDYDAVQEDLRQANETAANLEKQLAGKSRDMLHLKFLFDQTKTHLGHMQDNIVLLRKERHTLANEAMRAKGLDFMLARMTAERDRLKNELEGIIEGLALENAQKGLRFDKRDHRIAELTFEVMNLRQEVEDLRRMNPCLTPVAKPAPPREMPLKTSAQDSMGGECDLNGVEIVPTERTGGYRG
ncbi:MAG: hypothetical protein ABI318_10725 [Chthoniobacteraceae bacterium]